MTALSGQPIPLQDITIGYLAPMARVLLNRRRGGMAEWQLLLLMVQGRRMGGWRSTRRILIQPTRSVCCC